MTNDWNQSKTKKKKKKKKEGCSKRVSSSSSSGPSSPPSSISPDTLQRICISALVLFCLLQLKNASDLHFASSDDDYSDDDFLFDFVSRSLDSYDLPGRRTDNKFYDTAKGKQFHGQLDRWRRPEEASKIRTNQSSTSYRRDDLNFRQDFVPGLRHGHNKRRRSSSSRKFRSRHRKNAMKESEETVSSTTRHFKLPKPVIVMGFPKAGTSSIYEFFHRQGLRSQHWYCCGAQPAPNIGGPSLMAGCLLKNLRHNETMMKHCGSNIDVFAEINGPRRKKTHPYTGKTGWLLDDGSVDFESPKQRIFFPQHHRIHEIHQSYPNATWILNWRDTESWIDSVMKWGDDLQYQFAYEYYMQGDIPTVPRNTSEMRTFLREMYLDHFDMVRDFVKNHPSHNLVEINITAPDAGETLADAFGFLDPSAWSNVNKNQKDMMFRHLWHRRIRLPVGFSHLLFFIIGTTAAAYVYRKRPSWPRNYRI